MVAAQLDDGTCIFGRMHSFNVDPDESENRDIVVSAPIRLITADGNEHVLANQFTIISARHIVRLDVTHLPSSVQFASDI
jgi:hypothetical protein